MWTRNFFTCIVVLLSFTVGAQTYSDNREKFVKEFQKQMVDYAKGDSKDFVKEKFPTLLLETSDFPDEYFSKMVATCNVLVEKRFKTFPEIYNYIYSVSAFVENKQSKDSYNAWHESVDKYSVHKTKKKFTNFIDFSAGFFSEQRIAASSDFEWYYLGGTYSFEFKKNAVINFSGGNLACRVSRGTGKSYKVLDSVEVINTQGTYDPVLKKWKGYGGKVTWERVELSPSETYAELKGFDLSMKKSVLRVDSVSLTTPYFDQPIAGSLTERAFKISREEDKKFPQFRSFDMKLVIEEIVPNVDYVGGFELKGQNFYGAGTAASLSEIVVKNEGVPFIKAKAEQIVVQKEKIQIGRAETTLFLKSGDSLYHPGVNFKFDFKENAITLARSSSGIGQAAFENSYHMVDMYVPKIVWEYGSDQLSITYEFGTSQEQRIARIESKNFFDERLYDKLQGLSSKHPLTLLGDYAYKYDEPKMTEGKAASALGMSLEQAKRQLIELSNLGFITYDSERKIVIINDKLNTFVRAKAGTSDFDNIAFVSDMRPKKSRLLEGKSKDEIRADEYLRYLDSLFEKTNAQRNRMKEFGSLDLTTLNLNIDAVDVVDISKRNNVVVIPEGNKLLVRKNRDFNFSGWLYAGKAEIDAVAANFVYDDFKIKLLQTNETVLKVRPFKRTDGERNVKMVSSISGISGEILIDDPKNKSGLDKDHSDFPKLISSSKSKIYYNDRNIFRGAYDSSRFYYTVDPFQLDTLNDFAERALRLEGELTSAGIFPKIREDIKIMPDYSFGFKTEAPSGGYEFYGTDAKYENKIVLSHNGLQGAGTINFIRSTSVSKSLLSFLPDSTVGVVDFINRPSDAGVEFPPVESDEAYMTYVPRKNLLKASSMPKKELSFFGGDAKLRGTLAIRPEGMTGKGLMSFERATLISDNFDYKRWDIDSDTSSFSLKNDDDAYAGGENALAFNTTNVSSHVSFKERKGIFNSNEGESEVNFPVNQYMCKMDKFTWFMDDYEIEMERQEDKNLAIDAGIDLKGPNFYSTHPKQDSLQFRAPKAKFDIKDKAIYCTEVEYLEIADARIYPDSMKVNIRKKAKIDKFIDAKIIASYPTNYHKFQEAEVEIKARRDYKAEGKYPYYDLDSNLYLVEMKNIRPDSSYQTRASGKISEDQEFKLSPQFDYYGKVSIRASNPLILFDGATRINHTCTKFDRNWMSFTSEIDPKNIQIPVEENMKDLDGGAISAGIVWRDSPSTDSLKLYPTFLSSLVKSSDPIVMTASGWLQYNSGSKEFQIGSKEKLINRGEAGNYIALHTESCSMNGDGVIELGMDYGAIDVDAVGIVNYNQSTGETSMNITAKFTMDVDKGIMQNLADRLNALEGLKPLDFGTNTLEQAVLEWDDQKTADDFKSKYVIDQTVKKVPSGLNSTFTITGIHLSSYSDGDQNRGLITNVQSAQLVSIYGKPVMKYVPFRAFFQQMHAPSDKFTMLIDIPGGNDYLFDYTMLKKDGSLKIVSGDAEFTGAISALKEDKRKSKNFKYEVSSQSIFKLNLMGLFTDK